MNTIKHISIISTLLIRIIAFNKKWVLNVIMLTFWLTANSQDSLQFYLQLAAQNNPTVMQKYTEYQASLQKIPQAGSLPDPQLSAGVFLSPMELISGKQIATLQLMQMLPWFGVLQRAKDEMSLMAKAKYELFTDAKLQVQYETQRIYYELHKLQYTIQISEKNKEILQTLERLSLAKYKSNSNNATSSNSINNKTNNNQIATTGGGMNSSANMTNQQSKPAMQNNGMPASSASYGLVDVYRIQIEISELEDNIAFLNNQLITTTAQFNNLINRPIKSIVSVQDSIEPDSINIALLTLTDSITINNPMITMLQYEQQSLEARKQMVTRMGYPMVGLGFNYSLITKSSMSTSEMNGKDMFMPMITITLPIYRKKYKAMQNEANLLKMASEQNLQAIKNSLQTEFYSAIQSYHDAKRQIKLYENQLVLSQKSLEIMLKSFSASGVGLDEILRLRQQTLDYESKRIEAIADLNTTIALLKRLGNL